MKKLVHSFAVVFAFSIAIECTGRTGAEIDLNFDPYLTELRAIQKICSSTQHPRHGSCNGRMDWVSYQGLPIGRRNRFFCTTTDTGIT